MRTDITCFPCFLRQTVIALSQIPGEPSLHEEVMRRVIPLVEKADTAMPPSYTATFIHRLIRQLLGEDPFRKVKEDYNGLALELYPKLKETVRNSHDPLWAASRLAISGNVIDFGIFTSVDVEDSIKRSLAPQIALDDYASFGKDIEKAKDILYLLDNAGEIVFDRLLIEELVSLGKNVTAVVKGSPVLNDVTTRDADQTGLADVCEVIGNGSDAVGTIMEWTSPEFQLRYRDAGLVISKGQGNFETLAGDGKETYFLLQSKCDVVSKELGLSSGSMLLKKA